jgi:hypothetical protein
MGHTQTTQNDNNRLCVLVRAKNHFFACFPAMVMAMAMCGFMFMRG